MLHGKAPDGDNRLVALPVDLIWPVKMVTSPCAILRTLRPSAKMVGLIQSRSIASSSISFAERKKTCLHEIHVSHGGKMCDFAGYAMPTQYAGEGITESHKHTRWVPFFSSLHITSPRISFRLSITICLASNILPTSKRKFNMPSKYDIFSLLETFNSNPNIDLHPL